jgi:hypothetical protein
LPGIGQLYSPSVLAVFAAFSMATAEFIVGRAGASGASHVPPLGVKSITGYSIDMRALRRQDGLAIN